MTTEVDYHPPIHHSLGSLHDEGQTVIDNVELTVGDLGVDCEIRYKYTDSTQR